MAVQSISIDTSVLVERLTKPRVDWSVELHQLCDKTRFHWHWDEYTRQQFRNVVIPPAILAHTLLSGCVTIAHAVLRCASLKYGGGDAGGRRAAAMLNTLSHAFSTTLPGSTASELRTLVLDQLGAYLDAELADFGDDLIDVHTDAIKCVFASGGVSLRVGIYAFQPRPSCSQGQPRSCNIEQFWAGHPGELAGIGGANVTTTGTARIKKAAADCAAGRSRVRGRNCTVPLSDAVIYLTSVATGTVATTNVADFVFIEAATTASVKVHPVSVNPSGIP